MTLGGKQLGLSRRPSRRPRTETAAATGSDRGEPATARVVAAPVSASILRARWRLAFDAAQAALRAGNAYPRGLSSQELHAHSTLLAGERRPTAQLLEAFAHEQRANASFLHLLLPPREAQRVLGLPLELRACVFNLDGVLIGSAAVHAAAWLETFDEFISRRVERTGGRFAPFSPRIDYPAHLHGKPRLDGVRAFLASRGIRLPEGSPGDPPGLETVQALAERKNVALLHLLDTHGLTAYEGAHEYLETVRDAGLRAAVISASANTDRLLERTGLASLIDGYVDGAAIVADALRPRPEPDIVLAACRRLGVEPRNAAVFETSPAGVVAACTAGCGFVIGIDRSGQAKALLNAGADLVASGLEELLDHTLAA